MSKKIATKKTVDPRIANVLARLDEWEEHCLNSEEQKRDEVGRFVGNMMDELDWSTLSQGRLRSVLLAIMDEVREGYPEELDNMSKHADNERFTFMTCGPGVEAMEALEKLGLSPVDAERTVERVASELLAKARVAA